MAEAKHGTKIHLRPVHCAFSSAWPEEAYVAWTREIETQAAYLSSEDSGGPVYPCSLKPTYSGGAGEGLPVA